MAAPKRERNYAKSRERQISDHRWVAARALYEGTPGMTFPQLAKETKIGTSTLQRKANEDGWVKARDPAQLAAMSAAAQEVADRFASKVAEYGDEISAEQKAAAVAETVQETAVLERGKVLDRHRREWAAPRKLSYEAVQNRDFERAKLAKITAETLKIIQEGERKAWGLDQSGDGDAKGVTVVIERE